MPLTIRSLIPSDEPAWRKLWRAYLDFYKTKLPENVYVTTWQRLLSDTCGDPCGLLAELDGKPVGLAHYLFQRHGWRIERVTYLQDLYVTSTARRQAVGRSLIEAVYDRADQAGNPQVYWMTADDNEAARQLYDRIGQLTPYIRYERKI